MVFPYQWPYQMNWWFEENKAGAFLTAVQDLDNVVILGNFLCSGGFLDPFCLTKTLTDECA